METRSATGNPSRDHRWESLSQAEFRVVALVCEGLTNPEIADRLYLSRRTVQSHLYSIFKKVGARSRTELATMAVRDGIGNPD